MQCPFCNSDQITVTNSRPTGRSTQIWRRRKCLKCGEFFTTYEGIDLSYLLVIKKNGKIQKYNRSKLFTAIYHSAVEAKNADRGDMAKFAEEITSEIEKDIIQLKERKISTSVIIDLVLKNIHKKSSAVFLKFLAYREGNNEKKMMEFIEKYLRA